MIGALFILGIISIMFAYVIVSGINKRFEEINSDLEEKFEHELKDLRRNLKTEKSDSTNTKKLPKVVINYDHDEPAKNTIINYDIPQKDKKCYNCTHMNSFLRFCDEMACTVSLGDSCNCFAPGASYVAKIKSENRKKEYGFIEGNSKIERKYQICENCDHVKMQYVYSGMIYVCNLHDATVNKVDTCEDFVPCSTIISERNKANKIKRNEEAEDKCSTV